MWALREQQSMSWIGNPMLCYKCAIAELGDKMRKNTVKIRLCAILLIVAIFAVVGGISFLMPCYTPSSHTKCH